MFCSCVPLPIGNFKYDRGVADFVAIQVQDRQHGTISNWIEQLLDCQAVAKEPVSASPSPMTQATIRSRSAYKSSSCRFISRKTPLNNRSIWSQIISRRLYRSIRSFNNLAIDHVNRPLCLRCYTCIVGNDRNRRALLI